MNTPSPRRLVCLSWEAIEKGINGGARTVLYNVALLSAGLYSIKLAVNGKVMTEKLVQR